MIDRAVNTIPILRLVYGFLMRYKFQTNGYSRFWGVYETFEAAIQAAPKTKDIGYDNVELAQKYHQMLEQDNWENSGRTIAGHDYPVLFWLKSIFDRGEAKTVFDFGGNVGVHFYSYTKYLQYPTGLQWTICEVPEIAKVGEQIATQRGIDNLVFTSDLRDVQDKNIFLASGSIQYVQSLVESLSVPNKPQHLIINRLPLYDGDRFVTLQNGGNVFYPQYIFNKTEFIEGLERIGYRLVDIWGNQGDSCLIPLHLEKSVRHYSGLYFELVS